jgi:hypothetical protein
MILTNDDDEPSEELILEVEAMLAIMPEKDALEIYTLQNGSPEGFAEFMCNLLEAYKRRQN